MMDGSAVKEIAALEDAGKTIEVNGRTFARETFKPVYHDPRPSEIEANTLTGLVDYLRANREGVNPADCMVIVRNHLRVELVEKFGGESKSRTTFFVSELDQHLPTFPFDSFLSVEDFIIKARALMVPSESLDAVVALVSKVTEQNQIIALDDGISQEVQVKKGVSGSMTVGETTKGVYALRPFRTFRECEQPESSFILRLKAVSEGLPRAALFDAEGGLWRLQAIAGVKEFLIDQFSAYGIEIPVIA